MNDKKVPAPTNVYKLISYLQTYGDKNKTSKIHQLVSDSIQYNLSEFQILGVDEKNKLTGEIEQYLNTKTKRLLFIKISTLDFLSKEKIIEDFGKIGINDADMLAEDGLLNKDNNVYSIPENLKKHSYSNLMSKLIIQEVVEQFFKADLTTNYLSLQVSTTSVEGYNQIMSLQKKYYEDLKQILNLQKGQVPFFQIQCLDTLTVEKYRKEEK